MKKSSLNLSKRQKEKPQELEQSYFKNLSGFARKLFKSTLFLVGICSLMSFDGQQGASFFQKMLQHVKAEVAETLLEEELINVQEAANMNLMVLPAPGGVDANLSLWLKADNGASTANWLDHSGLGNNATGRSAAGGATGAMMNFNQTVSFAGATHDEAYDPPVTILGTGNTSHTFFSVGQGTGGTWLSGGTNNSTGNSFYIRNNLPNGSYDFNGLPLGVAGVTSAPRIMMGAYESSTATRDISINSGALSSVSTPTTPFNFDGNNILIGHDNSTGTSIYSGTIGEIIVYDNQNVSAFQKLQIHAYLALKYGITIDQTVAIDYIASDGTTRMWNALLNTTYSNDVFGIGRDDDSALDQRVSKSINSGAIFTVALDNDFTAANNDAARTNAFASDLQFLTFANDGGATTTQGSEVGGSYNVRVTREWQVQNVGSVGAVNVKFDGFADYDLLSDTDGDFSTTGDQTVLATLDANGEATGITFMDGAYITLAYTIHAPGGVLSSVGNVNGVTYELYSGYDSSPENGITGTLKQTGYVSTLQDTDDIFTEEIADAFSLVFKTNLQITSAGDYQFRFYAPDDNVVLFIDGAQVLIGACCSDVTSGNVNLTAGFHSLEARFSESVGGETISIGYQGPDNGNTFTHIPESAMFISSPILSAWYKADDGTTNTGHGTNVTAWADQSANANNTTLAVGTPIYNLTSNLANFNPSISFQDDQLESTDDVNGFAWGNSAKTTFSVVSKSAPITAGAGWISGIGIDNITSQAFGLYNTQDDVSLAATGNDVGQADFTTQASIPYLLSGSYQNSNILPANNTFLYGNGAQLQNQTKVWNTRLNDNEDFSIGVMTDNWGDGFDGNIMEVIYYPWELTVTERQKVESYLSLKYGITLDQATPTAYLASDGTTKMWDETVNTSYNQGIFGIGQDDASALDQRVAKSINAGSIFTVALDNDFTIANTDAARTTAFASDLQFLTFANDGGATTTQATELDAANYNVRIAREWQVQNTGSVGAVNVKFDGFANYDLLSDTDGDFSTTGDQTMLATLDANGEATGVTFTDGAYLTLAKIQAAPGAVSTDLTLWLKADAGVIGTTAVTSWADQSGVENNVTSGVAGTEPNATTRVLNFNPSIEFDGATKYLSDPNGIINGTQNNVHVYFVGISDVEKEQSVFDEGVDVGGKITDRLNIHFPWAGGTAYWDYGDIGTTGRLTADYDVALEGTLGQANVWNFISSQTDGEQVIRNNGKIVASDTDASAPTGSGADFFVGRDVSNNYFDGSINELIVYMGDQTATEIQIINAYLSLKYGITLDQTSAQDYLASDGTTKMWDATANAAYNQNIFGIGRDDAQALDQRVAKSINSGAIFTVALDNDFTAANNDAARTNAFASDLQFLTFANDGGATTTQGSEVGGSYNVRVTREWQVQNTGSVEAVAVKFEGFADYDLLADTDGDFSTTGDQTVLATLDANGEATGVTFTDGAYLTLAKIQVAPGGVATNNTLWLRADEGTSTTTDGADMTTWTDQSGNGNNATGIDAPQYQSNAINFNPALDFFDGVNSDELNGLTGGYYTDALYMVIQTQEDPLDNTFGPDLLFSHRNTENGIYLGEYTSSLSNEVITMNFATEKKAIAGESFTGALLVKVSEDGSNYTMGVNGQDYTLATFGGFNQLTDANYSIGRRSLTNDLAYNGYVAEVVNYSVENLGIEEQKIESYLALKYGITLDQATPTAYLASDSTVIWDATANAAYSNDIAGIGQDDVSVLLQKQSKSANPDGILAIGLDMIAASNQANTATFAANQSFMAWGNNDGAAAWTATGAPTNYELLARQWKIQETGTVGSVAMRFDVGDAEFDVPNLLKGATYFLVYDSNDDGDLSDETPVALTNSSGDIWETSSNIDFADGTVFTLATDACMPPAITTEAMSVTTCEGTNAMMYVAATGDGLAYQWQLDSGGGFADMGSETNDTLMLTSIMAAMDGNSYRVIVSGNCTPNDTSATATLTIENVNCDTDEDGYCDVNCDTNNDSTCNYNCDTDGDNIPDTNIDVDMDSIPDINLDTNNDSIPDVNIDTDNDSIPDLNIDNNNDGTCDLNCDTDGDGMADTNVDTDGDGMADLNIDSNNDGTCDLNCDTDGDGMADTNVDTDGDGMADLNIDSNNDGTCDLNCDTDGDGMADTNVDTDGDGMADLNIDSNNDGTCDLNCDTDGDGMADTNVDTDGDGMADLNIDSNNDGTCDLNCDTDGDGMADTNVDTDGDGMADLNIDSNNDGTCDLNCDTDGDGMADTNVDTDGDGMADLNIDSNNDGTCDLNCDTDGDGMADTNVDTDGDGMADLNIDSNNDGTCDLNCDTDGDGMADTNVDTDGDGTADTNIDTDGNGTPDLNIDSDGDGMCDLNCDTDGDGTADTNVDSDGDGMCDANCLVGGVCSLNCDTDGDSNCDYNCDTDGDNMADTNIDINMDSIPDINIDTNMDSIPDLNIDNNNDSIPDLNIDNNNDGVCDVDCDTDGDGTADTNLDTDGDGTPDLNIDNDNDGVCDVDCDTDGDGMADTNLDTDGDGTPDLNIDNDNDGVCDVDCDTDGDGMADTNLDTDGDGTPDLNIDNDNDGVCDVDCDTDGDGTADTNLDTDGDGTPDLNIDNDNDGICDVDCDTDGDGTADTNLDTDGDGTPDLNIDNDNDGVCDVDCDTDGDGTADTNLDTDGDGSPDVNIDTDNDGTPDVNIDTDGDGTPDVNVDTDGDGTADTNIDTDGDGTPDLNIDSDGDGMCDLNCDTDGDGTADTNVDSDGDGMCDANCLVGGVCSLNCDTDGDNDCDYNCDTDGDNMADTNIDINMDSIPDINIDTNMDSIPDLNIDNNNDSIPDLNIDNDNDGVCDVDCDTDGDGTADTNLDTDGDGTPDLNIDNDNDGVCDVDCDTDGDGMADTNLDTDGDGTPDLNIDNDNDGVCDVDCDTDGDGTADTNLDTDGDGTPDLNIDNDNDGVCDVDCDTDGDGTADTNLDTDGDGTPDLNIDNDNDGVCDVDCDTDGDGTADTNLDTDGDGTPDLNIDNDNDGVCDVDCDTDGDGTADTNLDTDGDGTPDVNIDTDNDGTPDVNIDTDGDGTPDVNVDTDGDGTADTNIDTDGDGTPDLNIDSDGDGMCDLNCDTDGDGTADTNVDSDGDGMCDANCLVGGVCSLNCDTDGDNDCDYNCDTDGDNMADTNIDINMDSIPDINIDTNMDSIPDLNIDNNNDSIPDLNIDTNNDGVCDVDCDTDGDGTADTNLDTDGDGTPDLNIDNDNDGICDVDCDTDGDGTADTNLDTDGDGTPDLNIDNDNDGVCDVDCDTDGDGTADTNLDTDGDGTPDLNIDNDNDGICDVDCDTDGDGTADTNLDTDGDGTPDLNIDNDNDGICDVDCDTDGDGTADTNLDTDGDGTPDLNIDNDNDGVCDVDCDTDGDGTADTNLDTDGDGTPDLNIDNDNDGVCDVDCDTDGDGTADTNLDTDGDGTPDVNIDTDGDGTPDVNIDTDGDGTPDVNIDTDGDGTPDVNIDTDGDGTPDVNIDTDGDGTPDVNIDTDGDGTPDVNIDTDGDGTPDVNIDTDGDGTPDVNIDTDGDGTPDVNIDTDGDGTPDVNIDTDGDGTPDVNIDTDGDGTPDVNIDTDGDGTPDVNIDTDGDGTPDVNIDTDGDGTPDVNIDTDGDGTPDVNIDTDGDGTPDVNIDTDGDGTPDVNIDTDGDGTPDVNIDTDGDGTPDVNIDTDGDGTPDVNIDTDGDGTPDVNIDTDGDGTPDVNIDTDGDGTPDVNIDTDGDGTPDVNVDTDGDGTPDVNVDTDGDGTPDLNVDTDGDGMCDSNCDADGDGNCDINCDDQIQVAAKVFLVGAYNTADGMMKDSLRSQGLIPTAQPYNVLSDFNYLGSESTTSAVFSTTGSDAIVDWVMVELRDQANPATVIESRAALVQKDGDIVDMDGTAALGFTSVAGDYYIAIRHRNHLGCMSATAMTFTAGTAVPVDFTSAATSTYQLAGTDGSAHARATLSDGKMALWSGNYRDGDKIIFQGSNSDVDDVFIKVITALGNTTFLPVYIVNNTYDVADGNLDGKIILQGANADQDQIFISVTSHPDNTDNLPIFVIREQIPR